MPQWILVNVMITYAPRKIIPQDNVNHQSINPHRFIPNFDPLLICLQVRGIVEVEFSFAEVF